MSQSNWQIKQRKEKYNRYLRSPAWTHKRFEVLRRDGYICQMCKANPAQHIHHKTYANFGNEPLSDLVAVCQQCHDKHHGR